jgi:putative nucleotidyltransferase with HDIG domain
MRHTPAHNPRYGRGEITLAEGDLPVDLEALTQKVSALFQSPTHRPPLPPAVAVEVLELSRQPDARLERIAALLQKDPLLAGSVVKIASSPLYGGAQIHALRDALVRLGNRGLRDVILEAAMNLKVFRSKRYGAAMEQVRVHSVAVAHVARVVCRYTAIDAEHAFLCGLFHDVGAAAALLALEEEKGRDLDATELAVVLADVHVAGTALLSRAWQLPPDVQFVVSHHHQLMHQGYAHPVIAALMYAEHLLQTLAPPFVLDSETAPLAPLREALSLTPAGEKEIAKAAAEALQHL